MIAIALAFTLQAAAPEPAELRALSAAVQAWDECLDAAARKYEPSGEPANAVAIAALFDCQPEDLAIHNAGVEFALANSPTMSREDASERGLTQRESRLRLREWRLTQSVVAARLRARQ